MNQLYIVEVDRKKRTALCVLSYVDGQINEHVDMLCDLLSVQNKQRVRMSLKHYLADLSTNSFVTFKAQAGLDANARAYLSRSSGCMGFVGQWKSEYEGIEFSDITVVSSDNGADSKQEDVISVSPEVSKKWSLRCKPSFTPIRAFIYPEAASAAL
eukprot:TRINITY_DN5169_c0_g1_i1.p1 TRINITY_DN5169_c0_g1~~TRINITY_DN5169_c0_g1_i1.p1  ORF type:complete len:167 (+),score=50.88 TRINITY_DN5169_c0_g1_i1:36-503(+)